MSLLRLDPFQGLDLFFSSSFFSSPSHTRQMSDDIDFVPDDEREVRYCFCITLDLF